MDAIAAMLQGREGERIYLNKIRPALHIQGNIQQLDGLEKDNNGQYTVVEVKFKNEMFKAPPFNGHGANCNQIALRMQLFRDLNIRTKYMILDKQNDCIFWNYIDQLEKGVYFDTEKHIRIYPLELFNKAPFPLSDIWKERPDFLKVEDLYSYFNSFDESIKKDFINRISDYLKKQDTESI